MSVIYPYEGRERDLSTLKSLAGSKSIRLFKNDITPDIDTELGDFTEADYSGYNELGVTLGVINRNLDDNAEAIADQVVFEHNGGGTANDIYGWYQVEVFGGPTALKYCERFADAPRVMDGSGDEISITLSIAQGGCP